MRAGDMRHRVTIQVQSKAPDGMGGFEVTWTDLDTVWAAIWPIRGAERIEAMKLEGKVTHQIRIWYRDDVTPLANRLKLGNRYFNIRSAVDAYEKRINLDILAEETV